VPVIGLLAIASICMQCAKMVDVCINRPIKVALADEYTKAIAASIKKQRDRCLMAVTPIPLSQLKAQLTASLHLALSSMSDGEIVHNGWRKIWMENGLGVEYRLSEP
jgi:hypothetical protein